MAPTMGQAKDIGETCEALKTTAAAIRTGATLASNGLPFTRVLHIGIGGSVRPGPRFVTNALHGQPGGLPVDYVDNIDPHGILQLLESIGNQLDNTLIIVVSKSGSTIETMTAATIVPERLEKRGIDYRPHTVAVTTPGSKLDKLAEKSHWLHTFYLWNWVGGRFSVTSLLACLPRRVNRHR